MQGTTNATRPSNAVSLDMLEMRRQAAQRQFGGGRFQKCSREPMQWHDHAKELAVPFVDTITVLQPVLC
jgi:hypothetical protein